MAMINRRYFFDNIRTSLFGGKISTDQFNGLAAILDAWEASGLEDDRWLSYMLATAYHETAATMRPIAEFGKGKNRDYGRRIKMNRQPYTDTPHIFYGRGYVQLTWYENYQKLGNLLGVDLLHNPDLAMRPDIAAKIMFAGMTKGLFTGKRLSDYFDADTTDWVNARRIINGNDRAELIAGYAQKFHAAISNKD